MNAEKNKHFFDLKSLKKIICAFFYSLSGLQFLLKERAFIQELGLVIVLVMLSFFIAENLNEWIILIVSSLMILLVEAINSAIEAVVDRINLEIHPLSKKAKDIASFCVFLTFIIVALIWLGVIFN